MIIGLTGYAHSGKDTVAKILIDNYGYTRIAFADKIREILYEMDPLIKGEHLVNIVDHYGWDIAKTRPEARRALQTLGIGARKVFGEDFWINQAFKSIDVDLLGDYVITDVRFLNEAQAIKEEGGQIWNIKRKDVGAVNGHISESALDGYVADVTIFNNWTIEDLEEMVRGAMENAKSIS